MTILTERKVWSRPRKPSRVAALTPEEQNHLRAAIRVLALRYGSLDQLAVALGSSATTVYHCATKRVPSVAFALRVARLAGVPVDDVMAGRWPPSGMCPHCGRG